MKRNLTTLSEVARNFQPRLPTGLRDNCESGALQKI